MFSSRTESDESPCSDKYSRRNYLQSPARSGSSSRFQDRGFEILGMNNDEDPAQVKEWLVKNGIKWTQATMASIRD
jgi:hypothetical protein